MQSYRVQESSPGRLAHMIAAAIFGQFRIKFNGILKTRVSNFVDPVNYDSDLLVRSIITKTKEYSKRVYQGHLTPESFRTLAAVGISSEGVTNLNVIDFGGGAGGHFFVAKKGFPEKKLNWIIVERPKMVSLCINEGMNEISFLTSIGEASKLMPHPDLIILNASIHYTEEPLETLSSICDLKSRWIFITRTPLTEEDRVLSLVQESRLRKNGPGHVNNSMQDALVKVLIKVVTKDSFEKCLTEKYNIRLSFEEELLHVSAKAQSVKTYGYLCQLRE